MCQFCTKHGEGKKWYLQAKNYSDEMMVKAGTKEVAESFFKNTGTSSALDDVVKLDKLPADSIVGKLIRRSIEKKYKKTHYGQVVPIEDVEKILDMSSSVTRLACICRYNSRGKDMRYCYGLTSALGDSINAYPDFGESLESMNKDEALESIHSLEHDGMMHSVWTHGTPYITAVCNCDGDCMAYKALRNINLRVFFRGEYVAKVDMDLCKGCRNCMRQCLFGAISYSVPMKRCFVDISKCYGCGICRATCSKEAIDLMDRNAIPAVRNVW